MCNCNIVKLIKGTKNLQLTNINNKFDYIYLTKDESKYTQEFINYFMYYIFIKYINNILKNTCKINK